MSVLAILIRAHDNGGQTRLRGVSEINDYIKCCQLGYLKPVYEAGSDVYLHHLLTDSGRQELLRLAMSDNGPD